MAIPTVFDITFGCGHAGTVNAADRTADQRGPWIASLSCKGMCPEGFEAARDKRRELARTHFDPINTLVTDRGWRCAQDSDAMWEVVRCWPGLVGGAIPVVTGR